VCGSSAAEALRGHVADERGAAIAGIVLLWSVLVVIDGSKALRSAVRAVFGPRAVVQRFRHTSNHMDLPVYWDRL
jgi:hypothetical protein